MTKLNIIWLVILSVLAAFLLLLFHGALFSACYSPLPNFKGYEFIPNQPLANCLIYAVSFALSLLIILPILINLICYAIYALIFNREMPFTNTILWFSWLTALYFLLFQTYDLPNILPWL